MPSRDLIDADPRLRECFRVISDRFAKWFPGWRLVVSCTYRSPEEQLVEFRAGRSRIDGIKNRGNHNYKPSRAIDVMIVSPGGLLLDTLLANKRVSLEQFRAMYGLLVMWAQELGFRSGGDWNGNKILVGPDPEESLDDPYHIELLPGT